MLAHVSVLESARITDVSSPVYSISTVGSVDYPAHEFNGENCAIIRWKRKKLQIFCGFIGLIAAGVMRASLCCLQLRTVGVTDRVFQSNLK